MNKNMLLMQILFLVIAVFFLLMSRIYPFALLGFIISYSILAYLVYTSKDLIGLAFISGFTSVTLALRFKYLAWGDPWRDYAMVWRILVHDSIAPEVYPYQQPALHLMLAVPSSLYGLDPMILQRLIVPLLSSISIIVIYKIAREFFDTDTAFIAGLLLMIGTPYLHWTTQAVAETLGIPVFLLAFYFSFKALQSMKIGHILASLLLVMGLILTHHLSTIVFLISWASFSLVYLLLAGDTRQMAAKSIYALVVSLTALSAGLIWWRNRLPYIAMSIEKPLNTISSSQDGIMYMFLLLVLLYLPGLIPRNKIISLRDHLDRLLCRKNAIYTVFIVFCGLVILIVLNFITGRSFFVLNYPPVMMFNGFFMLILAMIGFYFFLDSHKLPIISWAAGIALVLVLSLMRIIYAEDPLRFIEFLYIPLTIISAAGLAYLFQRIRDYRISGIFMSVILLFSLMTSFPSIVFSGSIFKQGDIWFDNRNLVISHPESEIKTINWLHEKDIRGNIYTDTYIFWASQWINYNNTIKFYNYGQTNPARVDPQKFSSESYAIITGRMKKYAEFGEWLAAGKMPLGEEEVQRLNNLISQIYDNGDGEVFYK